MHVNAGSDGSFLSKKCGRHLIKTTLIQEYLS
jgi:hypothetical protein